MTNPQLDPTVQRLKDQIWATNKLALDRAIDICRRAQSNRAYHHAAVRMTLLKDGILVAVGEVRLVTPCPKSNR